MVGKGQQSPVPTHYKVLGLSEAENVARKISIQQLKAAYRASLLRHHPDKATLGNANTSSREIGTDGYSVDQITQAYAILSVPKLRAQYDRDISLQRSSNSAGQECQDSFRTGVEIVDLDDMDFDGLENVWYRSCRCGDARGFVVTEADLEEVAEDGEVNVGCKGCSLWMKVLFQAVDDGPEPPLSTDRPGG